MKVPSILGVLLACLSVSCSQKEVTQKLPDTSIEESPEPSVKVIDTYNEEDKLTIDKNHPDAKTIQQLKEAGSDFTKPHTPDFQFDFKELSDARRVAEILSGKDFESKIYAPQENFPTYELIAKKKMIIELEAMVKLTRYLEKLATDNSGELSGWGSPVEK
jgi:hypothetical protein